MTRLLTTALLIATLFTASTLLSSPTATHAAAGTLYVSQSCAPDGVAVNFGWDGQDATLIQVWIDISIYDNGFAPGSFISAGPLPGWVSSYQWGGIRPSTTHYVRINQQRSNGLWDASGTFVVSTIACGGGAAIGVPSGTGRPSINNVSCTSSIDTANVSNVNPTDRKGGRINALPGDTVRCTANASGAYTSLTWRGPSGEEGVGPTFYTSAGPVRPANTPNTISLTLNWTGNPALADISVFIVAPPVQTCTTYYYPGMPYNPYTPCGY